MSQVTKQVFLPLLFSLALTGTLTAQSTETASPDSNLPDSPGYLATQNQPPATPAERFSSSAAGDPGASPAAADPGVSSGAIYPNAPTSHPYTHRVVKPGMGPQPLTGRQKLELSVGAPLRPMSFGANFISAGFSHLDNSRPHYGTDKAGFGERLGAAKLKQVGENFFSYGVFAAAFHEDPHYYVMGPGHSIGHRAVYAATRLILTQKDDGNTGINYAKLSGLAASNALVNLYYPDRDRGLKPSAMAYLTNLGSTAMTLELSEFLPDVLKIVHKPKE